MKESAESVEQLLAELASARTRIAELEDVAARSQGGGAANGVSGTWFKNLLETIPDLVWFKDVNGVFLACNKSFERLLGAKESEIIGKTDYDFVERELADFFRANDLIAIAQDGPCSNEEWLTFAADGYHGLFETIKTPMRDGKGNVIGVLGIARDITGRKQTEDALRQAEASYRELVESAPIGIFKTTPDGRYLMANSKLAEMFGYESVQDLVESVQDIGGQLYVDQDEREGLLRGSEMNALAGKALRRRKKDGTIIWVVTSMRCVRDRDGVITHYEGFTSDISDRVRMEEAMIQTEKMISIGGLAAGMAHEINNPLSGVLINLQNILRRVSPGLTANESAAVKAGCDLESVRGYLADRQVFTYLDSAVESAHRAARIVANMLEFSRSSEKDHVSADVHELVDKAVGLAFADYVLMGTYDVRKIRIVREFAARHPLARCCGTEIEQVVFNLVKNAAQAMTGKEQGKDGPVLVLRTRNEDGVVVIEVEDNGPGMEESVRRRVFEPFFTTKPVGSGTGLGLSVCYYIVTGNHGGSIEVKSWPGRGTLFVIRLPGAKAL